MVWVITAVVPFDLLLPQGPSGTLLPPGTDRVQGAQEGWKKQHGQFKPDWSSSSKSKILTVLSNEGKGVAVLHLLMSAKRKAQIWTSVFKESWLNTAKAKDQPHQQKISMKQMLLLLICQHKHAVARDVSWCCVWLYREEANSISITHLPGCRTGKSSWGSQHLSHITPALCPPWKEKLSKRGIYDNS